MKKILAVVLALVMLLSAVNFGAVSLDFIKEYQNNYTADAEISISFNTAKELVTALEKMGINLSESVDYEMIDFVPFLKSLLSINGTAKVKADISDDFNVMRLSMSADYDYGVDVNNNLSVSADINQEMWMEIDLSDVSNPKYFMVMMSPLSTKYTYIDFFEGMKDEEKLMMTAILKSVFNKEFFEKINNELFALYEEYATESKDGKTVTVTLDNEGFLRICDKVIELVIDRMSVIIPGFSQTMEEIKLPKLSGLGIEVLGDKGIVMEYDRGGNVSFVCDICINVNEIVSAITGQQLPTENDIMIGFTISENGKIYDVGKTEIEMPELTEENSINLNEMLHGTDEDDDGENYEEYEPAYPNVYVDVYTDYIPSAEEIYVPFRMALETAYDGNVNISYENGVVTATSEYFTDLEKVSFTVGETKVNVDGIDFEVGKSILENGVTYVTADFFKIVFGWSLDWANYDMLYNEYNIGFYTDNFDYYDEW